jgi:hypothetical protein
MRAVIVAFSVLLAATCPAVAKAQTSPPSLSESLSGEAKQAYDSAKLLFEDGDAAGAITKFRRAHELSKDPRLLWNMAVCEKELRHYAAAARLVNQYLEEGAGKISAESRQSALATQEALRGFYSELTLDKLPPGARVTIDGVSAGTSPLRGPIPVDLGRRRIRVERDGYEPFERQLEVPGSTPISLEVVLTPAQTSAALSIKSTGPKDVISIDGKAVGSGQWQGSLPAGEHTVRVTAPGKKPYEAHLQLVAKGSRSLQVTLEDEKKGALWPWLVAGGAVVVGASIGGYFLFRPEDEPGKAPQGKLGTIYLPAMLRR